MAVRRALGTSWRTSFAKDAPLRFQSVTQPANIAGAIPSISRAQAKKRVLSLYGQAIRMAPRVYKVHN
jgi:hypothetical protein